MLPKVRFGKTGLEVTRLALGGYPFGGVNLARGWDPFSPAGRAQAIETVHAANMGMRWPDEVRKNVALASAFEPTFDMTGLPRMTAHIYKTHDEMEGLA